MLRLIFILFLISSTCLCQAESNEKFLIDFILFEHKILQEDALEQSLIPAILLPSSNSLHLISEEYETQPDFRSLPISQSELRETYYALSRNENYQVLARYTWTQPSNEKRGIDLPPITQEQWEIKGRIKLSPGRFPFLKTNLLLTNGQKTVALRHNQALKPKETYYLDHPVFGIIIRLTPTKLENETEKAPN